MVVGKLRRAVLAQAHQRVLLFESIHHDTIRIPPEKLKSLPLAQDSTITGLSCSSSVCAIFTSEHRAAARVKSGRWGGEATVQGRTPDLELKSWNFGIVILAPSKFHDVEIPSFLQKSWNREFEAQTRKLGIVILAFP